MLLHFNFFLDLFIFMLSVCALQLSHLDLVAGSSSESLNQTQQQQQSHLYSNETSYLVGRQDNGGGGGSSTMVESLFGQVAKTVVYGGASVVRLNSRILCPLFSHETEKDNEDQPTLFVFNNNRQREQAFRIYADDEINLEMVREAQFDSTQMTFIYVHGWLGGIHNEIWLSEAKNAALMGSSPYKSSSATTSTNYYQQQHYPSGSASATRSGGFSHSRSGNSRGSSSRRNVPSASGGARIQYNQINDPTAAATSEYDELLYSIGGNFTSGRLESASAVKVNKTSSTASPPSSSSSSSSTLEARQAPSNGSATTKSTTFKPNVIIVDWSEFAKGSLYSATQNSFKVSRRLARLLEQLTNVGRLRPELMHCFGHSIGTHICGQAARQAFPINKQGSGEGVGQLATRPGSLAGFLSAQNNRRMGRITGLDPGGFCYELGIKNETTYAGLRPSDALLVDAYHSNRSPFGNRYQVAHYNVRINNGFFQRPCSVWLNPDVASEYFRAAVRFSLGNIGHNDVLSCDHYFATRFAAQHVTPTCSFVGYACDSYRNFLRGRCGACKSPAQCYTMDFEYQRPNASVANALAHISKHSSYFNDFFSDDDDDEGNNSDESAASVFRTQPPGGVPYAKRLVYYMRITDEEPYCSTSYRVRVKLDRDTIDLGSFRNEWIKLYFLGPNEERIKIMDAGTGKASETLTLNGPWSFNSEANDEILNANGIDERTLTALFDVSPTSFIGTVYKSGLLNTSLISNILVEYDNGLHRRQHPIANPIETIKLDYLSSTDKKIRSANSLTFRRQDFKIVYKHLGVQHMSIDQRLP